jgi:hypothetical protein
VHVSCEGVEPLGDDRDAARRVNLTEMYLRADADLPADAPAAAAGRSGRLPDAPRTHRLGAACPRPLVRFLDEIDAVRGQRLVSVLRQLRAGFPERPAEPVQHQAGVAEVARLHAD